MRLRAGTWIVVVIVAGALVAATVALTVRPPVPSKRPAATRPGANLPAAEPSTAPLR